MYDHLEILVTTHFNRLLGYFTNLEQEFWLTSKGHPCVKWKLIGVNMKKSLLSCPL